MTLIGFPSARTHSQDAPLEELGELFPQIAAELSVPQVGATSAYNVAERALSRAGIRATLSPHVRVHDVGLLNVRHLQWLESKSEHELSGIQAAYCIKLRGQYYTFVACAGEGEQAVVKIFCGEVEEFAPEPRRQAQHHSGNGHDAGGMAN